jgi:hypothetical protein
MVERVRRGADERLDSQILFQCLKEQFDSPAVLIDARHGRRAERQMIGQELEAIALRSRDDRRSKPGYFFRVSGPRNRIH